MKESKQEKNKNKQAIKTTNKQEAHTPYQKINIQINKQTHTINNTSKYNKTDNRQAQTNNKREQNTHRQQTHQTKSQKQSQTKNEQHYPQTKTNKKNTDKHQAINNTHGENKTT